MTPERCAIQLSNAAGTDRWTRRRLLGAVCAVALAGITPPAGVRRAAAQARVTTDPFMLGVASGCPRPASVVLWTRLAPEPLTLGAGMGAAPVPVEWEIAADEHMRTVVGRGRSEAQASAGHSVHVTASGLEPDRPYWYRFRTGDAHSPIGRTRTAPAPEAEPARLRFAIASCQQYEQGWYAAWRHMAQDDVDLVVFLGDYIYESSWGRNHVRRHVGGVPVSLDEYRMRYAQYRSDPDLARMHATAPWLVTWDDHEVENDYANDRSQRLDPQFLVRRAAAYRAWYEHMPVPPSALPRGHELTLYDRHAFGRLASFHVLDGRQYRDHQVCPRPGRGGSNTVEDCPERTDPSRSLLGREQERWLADGLAGSRARWNVIAQQTLMAQADRKAGPGQSFWTDGWDGYPAARRRLLESIASLRPSNPLVVSGDVHMNYITDLKPDFDDPRSPVVATEICGTSISSQGWPQARVDALLAENPHLRYGNTRNRGYVAIELDRRRATATLRALASEKLPDSTIATQATFMVEDGKPGAVRA